jgi:hypothetical protein
MWRDELDEAQKYLLAGLKDVEAVGDVDTMFINLNYMALIGRKLGDVGMAREWAQRTVVLAEKAKNPFYRITAIGSLAWAAIHAGEEERARALLKEVLGLEEKVPSPIRFMALGPAIGMEVKHKDWEAAIKHAKLILHPSQQKMPDELQSMLEDAVAKWEAGDASATEALLEQSLAFMREKKMGYV